MKSKSEVVIAIATIVIVIQLGMILTKLDSLDLIRVNTGLTASRTLDVINK